MVHLVSHVRCRLHEVIRRACHTTLKAYKHLVSIESVGQMPVLIHGTRVVPERQLMLGREERAQLGAFLHVRVLYVQQRTVLDGEVAIRIQRNGRREMLNRLPGGRLVRSRAVLAPLTGPHAARQMIGRDRKGEPIGERGQLGKL